MVVTQYRLLVVSLRVLVGKDMPAAGREWWLMVSPHPVSPAGRAAFRAREPRAVSPHVTAPPIYWRTPDL